MLCAGGLASNGDSDSSLISDIIRDKRLYSGCLAALVVSRSEKDFRLIPAKAGGTPEGRRGTAKPSCPVEFTVEEGNGQ